MGGGGGLVTRPLHPEASSCTQRRGLGGEGGGGHRGYSNFNNMPRTLLVSDKAGFRAGEAAGTPAGEAKRWPARGGH